MVPAEVRIVDPHKARQKRGSCVWCFHTIAWNTLLRRVATPVNFSATVCTFNSVGR